MEDTNRKINEKEILDSSDVYLTIKPILYLSRVFGVAPISFPSIYKKNQNNKIYFFLKQRLYSIILIVLTVFMTLFSLIQASVDSRIGSDHPTLYFLNLFLFGIMTFSYLALSLMNFGKQIIIIIEKIAIVDEFLKIIGKKFAHNANWILVEVIVLASVIIVFLTAETMVNLKNNYFLFVSMIFVYMCMYLQFVVIIQFVNFVVIIKLLLKEVNSTISGKICIKSEIWRSLYEKISGIYSNPHQRSIKHNWFNDPIENNVILFHNNHCWNKIDLRCLRILNKNIYQIFMAVNSLYGCQMLQYFMYAFFQTTWYLYGLILEIVMGKSVSMDCIYWPIIYIITLLCITGACNSASKESRRTAELLQNLLLLSHIREGTVTEIRYFNEQLRIQKIKFSACDFFTINYSVLGPMVQAVVTLLVILVQFKIK